MLGNLNIYMCYTCCQLPIINQDWTDWGEEVKRRWSFEWVIIYLSSSQSYKHCSRCTAASKVVIYQYFLFVDNKYTEFMKVDLYIKARVYLSRLSSTPVNKWLLEYSIGIYIVNCNTQKYIIYKILGFNKYCK